MSTKLHEVTQAIVSVMSHCFVKVEPHDGSEPSDEDLLWLRETSDDDFSEGVVLCIGPGDIDHSIWSASVDAANRIGGWATQWSVVGSADEVISHVKKYLGTES